MRSRTTVATARSGKCAGKIGVSTFGLSMQCLQILDRAIDWRKCRCTRGYSPELVPFLKHFAVYIDFPCIMKSCCTALVGTAICGANLIDVAIPRHDDPMYGQALSSRKLDYPTWLCNKLSWRGICRQNKVTEYEGSYDW